MRATVSALGGVTTLFILLKRCLGGLFLLSLILMHFFLQQLTRWGCVIYRIKIIKKL